jgi:hypothetical protein
MKLSLWEKSGNKKPVSIGFLIINSYIQNPMKSAENKGFDAGVINEYKAKIRSSGKGFSFVQPDENNDDFAHFYFVGKFEGREVLYDAALYTLHMLYQSELYEIAEHRAAQHFPQYKKITYKEDENGNLQPLDELEEEIGLFMAEVIMDLEEEDQVKVKEHVDIDSKIDFGIGLDAGLNVEKITSKVIEKFIRDFNQDTLIMDTTLYSYQTEDDESVRGK